MKKLLKNGAIIAVCLIVLLSFSGCGDTMRIDGVEYDTYGLMNEDSKKNENVEYEVIWGNVIWGAVLFETIIGPIYFYGFSLFEPVGPKAEIKGQVVSER